MTEEKDIFIQAFRTAMHMLTVKIGKSSPGMQNAKATAGVPEAQMLASYSMEGGKELHHFIGVAMKNFTHIIGSVNVALSDINVLAVLLVGEALSHILQQGGKLPPGLFEEQVKLFEGGLRDIFEKLDKIETPPKIITTDV